MWDERYNREDYVYGTQPNEFLKESAAFLPKGRVLSLAEGEGRNAVFLARLGYEVTAVDSSSVGLEKAARLAKEFGVSIECVHADLAEFEFVPGAWDGVVSIFCHLPSELRARVYQGVSMGLSPGGVILLESYTPAQLLRDTGGPMDLDLLPDAEALRRSFAGFEFERLLELERAVVEGEFHTGLASVVQMVARKL